MSILSQFDQWLIHPPSMHANGLKRFCLEFLWFGLKEARACLFAGIFFISMVIVPQSGILGLPKYDVLLVIALLAQFFLIYSKLETWDEFKAICLFHAIGFALEVFKTSSSIGSWSYPLEAYTKVWNVPLFTGFMYAAVGSYIIQAWRLFDLKITYHPNFWVSAILSLLIYINFFSHHYWVDIRWYLAAFTLGLYANTKVLFTPYDRVRSMPLTLAFVLIGFFLWLAENFGTLLGMWQYPNQIGGWSVVHLSKWSAWTLVIVMTVCIVIQLKHLKNSVRYTKHYR